MVRRGDCEGFYNFGNHEKGGDFGEISALKRQLDSTSNQQAASKRIRELNPQETHINFCKESSPLGLKLSKTPSFINLIEMKLSQARKASDQDVRAKMDYEKLKASNFCATLLRIGTWERLSRNEGDLIAKCYYAKKKIVWEVLEGALKSKIEIQWSDIIGISAFLHDDQPGILEIELNNPPSYFQETNPQPRKHTLWHQATDFTGGQAPMYRRHYVVFPPGVLNKHYEKLLQCDHRLFELSKKTFPTLNNPYFGQRLYGFSGYSCNLDVNGSEFPPELQYHAQNFSTPAVHPHHHVQNFKVTPNPSLGIMDSTLPMLDMDNERARNYAIENQRAMLWSQGLNNTWAQSSMNMATKGNLGFPYQEFHPINSGEESGMNTRGNPGFPFQEFQPINSGEESGMNTQGNLGFPYQEFHPINSGEELGMNTQGNPGFPYQEFHPINSGDESGMNTPNSGISFADIENHLLTDSQKVVCSDAIVYSLNSLLDLQELSPNNNNIISNQLASAENNENFGVSNSIEYPGGLSFPKPISWLPPEDSNRTTTMNPSTNQTFCPYVLPEPTPQDFADLDASQDICRHWP